MRITKSTTIDLRIITNKTDLIREYDLADFDSLEELLEELRTDAENFYEL